MVLPVSLGSTAVVMLLNGALWAPGLARVLDQSLRYTVDKTTREILFLPLPSDIKLKAKSFLDVTVDRAAKAVGALLLLVLVQPWGLQLELAAAQLREPRDDGRVGLHVAPRAQGLPQGVPPEHRAARRRARRSPAERRRSVDDRDARGGAGAAGPGPRGVRHRHARVARQAQPRHAAPPLPRLADGEAARAARAGRRAQRHQRALAAAGAAHAGGRGFRRSGGRDHRDRRHQQRGCDRRCPGRCSPIRIRASA